MMVYGRRHFAYPLMFVGIILTLLLTACGGSSTGNTSGNTGSNGSCSNVQLPYWNGFSGPDGPVMGQMVKDFNKAHPSIQVTMTIVPLGNYATKLDTAAASDTLPDIAIINEDQMATQAYRHVIRSMDDIMPQIGYTNSDFPDIAWKTDNFAGHQYGIPLSIVPLTMFYNADLLPKAGFSTPPATADDFAKAAAAMTKGDTHGFQITTGFPVTQIFQQLLHQYGGSEFSSDGTQASWDSDAGVKAIQWMKDAQRKYSAPKLPVDADVNSFKAGKVGMIWNGIWQSTNVTGDAVDFKGMAGAVPQIGPSPANWAGMASMALPYHKSGVNKCKDQAAGTFIKYIVDNSIQWAKAGNVPAYNKVRNGSDMQSLPLQSSLAKVVENPIFPPPIPGVGDALGPLNDAVAALMTGTTTDLQKTLSDSVKRSNQILAQNKQKYGSQPPS